jgi:hypothetical protein
MTDQKNNSAQEQYDNRWDYILNRETDTPTSNSLDKQDNYDRTTNSTPDPN